MKYSVLSLAALLVISHSALATPTSLTLDPAASTLSWTGKKVTGQHMGKVQVKQGSVAIDGTTLVGGTFDIDMKSILVEDIKDPTYNKKLTDHLFSNDFFSVMDFPVANFSISKAEPIANAAAGAPNYSITGTLAIKGITNEVTFPATISIDKGVATASASIKLDRTKWNIRYGSGQFFQNLGDKLINDDFVVDLNVTAKA